ncbi:MAG TPA: CehA/McbA family metallohydrolase [Caulobacteraceae bacterium]
MEVSDAPAPDLILQGVITRADHETYRSEPFEVPAGVSRLTIAFDYDRAHRTTIDLGLLDGQGFRGWSGGDKSLFTLAAEDATASYLSGPIGAGRWTLLLGIPNIRTGVSAAYTAKIFFVRGPAAPRVSTFSDQPLKQGLAWYRGDLHMHTAHSDGGCCAQSGARAPSPLYRSVEAAAARGLDFIAITDHNTTSHFHAMRELQPAFDQLLLIPGREITTFHGHANIFGPTGFIDFRLGAESLPDADALCDAAQAMGGLLAVNHPCLPSNELCMGCGWTAPATDFSRVQAIEVANGGAERVMGGEEGPFSGIPFWQARLNEGHNITGIGGSDNHDASLAPDVFSAIGKPTTLIHAQSLCESAIVEAIRLGRVAIDLDGVRHRTLDLTARCADRQAIMGGDLAAGEGEDVAFEVTVGGVSSGHFEVVMDGETLSLACETAIGPGPTTRSFGIVADGRRHWVRINVRDGDGRLMLIGNPIYLVRG